MSASFAQKNAMDDNQSYTIRWGICVIKTSGGGNFSLLPPSGGRSKNVWKIALFHSVNDFHDFSCSNGDKIEKSKTIVSTTDTSPNIPRKFFPEISSTFWDPCLSLGTLHVQDGQWGSPAFSCSLDVAIVTSVTADINNGGYIRRLCTATGNNLIIDRVIPPWNECVRQK